MMANQILCSKHELRSLIEKAEKDKDQILKELKAFYTGDIDVRIYPVWHAMGWSVSADLLVNGEVCKTYDPADLCFIDLDALMIKRMVIAGIGPVA